MEANKSVADVKALVTSCEYKHWGILPGGRFESTTDGKCYSIWDLRSKLLEAANEEKAPCQEVEKVKNQIDDLSKGHFFGDLIHNICRLFINVVGSNWCQWGLNSKVNELAKNEFEIRDEEDEVDENVFITPEALGYINTVGCFEFSEVTGGVLRNSLLEAI